MIVPVKSPLSKGEQTRQKIIRKAAPIFNRHGYVGASLSELMKETGLEKGGIYRHFENKEELAVEAFDYSWSEIKRIRLEQLNNAPTPLGKLRAMVNHFATRPSPVPGGCALLNTAIDTDDGNPVLREHARNALHEWLDYLEMLVRQGIKEGEIRPKTSPRSVASIIIATLEGSLMMDRLTDSRDALKLARKHLHTFLDSIANKPK